MKRAIFKHPKDRQQDGREGALLATRGRPLRRQVDSEQAGPGQVGSPGRAPAVPDGPGASRRLLGTQMDKRPYRVGGPILEARLGPAALPPASKSSPAAQKTSFYADASSGSFQH